MNKSIVISIGVYHSLAILGNASGNVPGWFAIVHNHLQNLSRRHFFEGKFGLYIIIWAGDSLKVYDRIGFMHDRFVHDG